MFFEDNSFEYMNIWSFSILSDWNFGWKSRICANFEDKYRPKIDLSDRNDGWNQYYFLANSTEGNCNHVVRVLFGCHEGNCEVNSTLVLLTGFDSL